MRGRMWEVVMVYLARLNALEASSAIVDDWKNECRVASVWVASCPCNIELVMFFL